jgi:hypothetical protein
MKISYRMGLSDKHIAKWNSQITELQSKVDNSDKQYEMIVTNKIKEIKRVLKHSSEKEIEKNAINEARADKQRIEQEKAGYLNEMLHLKRLIEEASQNECVFAKTEEDAIEQYHEIESNHYNAICDSLEHSTDQQKYDIIHKHIKSVSITNYPEVTATKKIEIECLHEEVESETVIGMSFAEVASQRKRTITY